MTKLISFAVFFVALSVLTPGSFAHAYGNSDEEAAMRSDDFEADATDVPADVLNGSHQPAADSNNISAEDEAICRQAADGVLMAVNVCKEETDQATGRCEEARSDVEKKQAELGTKISEGMSQSFVQPLVDLKNLNEALAKNGREALKTCEEVLTECETRCYRTYKTAEQDPDVQKCQSHPEVSAGMKILAQLGTETRSNTADHRTCPGKLVKSKTQLENLIKNVEEQNRNLQAKIDSLQQGNPGGDDKGDGGASSMAKTAGADPFAGPKADGDPFANPLTTDPGKPALWPSDPTATKTAGNPAANPAGNPTGSPAGTPAGPPDPNKPWVTTVTHAGSSAGDPNKAGATPPTTQVGPSATPTNSPTSQTNTGGNNPRQSAGSPGGGSGGGSSSGGSGNAENTKNADKKKDNSLMSTLTSALPALMQAFMGQKPATTAAAPVMPQDNCITPQTPQMMTQCACAAGDRAACAQMSGGAQVEASSKFTAPLQGIGGAKLTNADEKMPNIEPGPGRLAPFEPTQQPGSSSPAGLYAGGGGMLGGGGGNFKPDPPAGGRRGSSLSADIYASGTRGGGGPLPVSSGRSYSNSSGRNYDRRDSASQGPVVPNLDQFKPRITPNDVQVAGLVRKAASDANAPNGKFSGGLSCDQIPGQCQSKDTLLFNTQRRFFTTWEPLDEN